MLSGQGNNHNNNLHARSFYQDTVVVQPDTGIIPVQDTGSFESGLAPTEFADTLFPINQSEIDTISTEGADTEVFVIRPQPSEPTTQKFNSYPEYLSEFSTNEVPYLVGSDSLKDLCQKTFLHQAGLQYFMVKDSSQLVFLNKPASDSIILQPSQSDRIVENIPENNLKPDWLLGIIIISLVVLAWIKLIYNKFIDQTFNALWNFQLSDKLFRDQSIFSRRVALVLNANFIITGGLFIFLVLAYTDRHLFNLKPFMQFLSYAGILLGFVLSRYILTHITGFIFRRQAIFREYLQQILIIYKGLGVFLIPLILGIAYISESLRIYLIITGITLFSAAYLFRFIKGFKLIFKKDVFISYLILYLCTLEILPVLVLYKFFNSLL